VSSARPWLGGAAFLIAIAAAVALAAKPAPVPAAPVPAAPPEWTWNLPPGFPPPRVPADNPMSVAKVELGRLLFYDTRLSANGAMSCASCHRPELAFSDGRPRPFGITGEPHPRSAPSLAGVAYGASLGWIDPAPASLEHQMLDPLFGHQPVELGNHRSSDLVGRLRGDLVLGWRFAAAFPGEAEALTIENLARAIAAFERTLISGRSDFDRWAYGGDEQALSPEARHGLALFHSARLGCGDCHARFTFSGPIAYQDSRDAEPLFYDTGFAAPGGGFRVPTLRNVAVTAPYMHDGRLQTLEAVIDHYQVAKAPELRQFKLDEQERRDLLAFLESLTDPEFLSDPRFGPPAN
jgi:cytochrome c peroxidase